LFQCIEDQVLEHAATNAAAIVAGSESTSGAAAEVIFTRCYKGRAAVPADRKAGQKVLRTSIKPELLGARLCDTFAVAYGGEAAMDAMPQKIIDDTQVRNIRNDPFALGIDPCQAPASIRVL